MGRGTMYFGLGGFILYGCMGAMWHNMYEQNIVEINMFWDRAVLKYMPVLGWMSNSNSKRRRGLGLNQVIDDTDMEGGDDKEFS